MEIMLIVIISCITLPIVIWIGKKIWHVLRHIYWKVQDIYENVQDNKKSKKILSSLTEEEKAERTKMLNTIDECYGWSEMLKNAEQSEITKEYAKALKVLHVRQKEERRREEIEKKERERWNALSPEQQEAELAEIERKQKEMIAKEEEKQAKRERQQEAERQRKIEQTRYEAEKERQRKEEEKARKKQQEKAERTARIGQGLFNAGVDILSSIAKDELEERRNKKRK